MTRDQLLDPVSCLHSRALTAPAGGTPGARMAGMARTTAAQVLGLGGTGATGWIDRRGHWIPCQYGTHLEAARVAGTIDPDGAGWIHVSRGVAIRPDLLPTQRQIDALADVLETLPTWALEAV